MARERFQANETIKLDPEKEGVFEWFAPDDEILLDPSSQVTKDLLSASCIRPAGEPRPEPRPSVTRVAGLEEEVASERPAKKATKKKATKKKATKNTTDNDSTD